MVENRLAPLLNVSSPGGCHVRQSAAALTQLPVKSQNLGKRKFKVLTFIDMTFRGQQRLINPGAVSFRQNGHL